MREGRERHANAGMASTIVQFSSVQRGENVFAPCRHCTSRSFNIGSGHWHQEPPAVRNVVPKAASPGRALVFPETRGER